MISFFSVITLSLATTILSAGGDAKICRRCDGVSDRASEVSENKNKYIAFAQVCSHVSQRGMQ